MRSYFEVQTASVYDDDIAQKRYQDVNERYRREIEAVWDQLKK